MKKIPLILMEVLTHLAYGRGFFISNSTHRGGNLLVLEKKK